jgi:acetylornithine deacetylase
MRSVGDAAQALLAELVAIDSVNPGLVDGAAGETEMVHFLKARLDAHGFATTVVAGQGRVDRPSLVAVSPAPADAPTVVLNGHLDTVGVAGMVSPFSPRVKGDRMTGRGTADMKGGIAAMVAAAERLAVDGAEVRTVLALVADEEDASLGSESVLAELPRLGVEPDVCLIAEPTDLELARSLRGFGVAHVRFAGRAAHSSQAHLGVNAVEHLGGLLHAVQERAAHQRGLGGDLMVTMVRGGSSPFVVPDNAECFVELRTAPGAPGSSVVEEVAALMRDEWDASVELASARDGWMQTTAGPAADLATRLGDRLGTGLTFDAPYWMEAPLWEQACPTLICGPSGGGLHAVDEWVDLGQVRAFASALVEVLARQGV